MIGYPPDGAWPPDHVRRPTGGDAGLGAVVTAMPGTVTNLAPRDGTLPAGGFCSAPSGAAATRA